MPSKGYVRRSEPPFFFNATAHFFHLIDRSIDNNKLVNLVNLVNFYKIITTDFSLLLSIIIYQLMSIFSGSEWVC